MKKMYLVEYSSGQYEDYRTYQIFVTDNEQVAIAYINKFNAILKKWQEYYLEYGKNPHNPYNGREYTIHEIHVAYKTEIEVR